MTPSIRTRSPSRPLAALAALALLMSSGCALFSGEGDGDIDTVMQGGADEQELDLIAQNLVFTLAQLGELNPMNTTVQLTRPRSAFGREIVRRVHGVGYGVQSVPDDRGANYLRYRVQRTVSEEADETRYLVSIGDVSVERSYQRIGDRLLPVSAQRVRGAVKPSAVELNDDLFALEEGSTLSDVEFGTEQGPRIIDIATGLGEPVEQAAGGEVDAFDLRVRQNLYGRLESNYAQIFVDYEDIEQDSLSFPNDSMLLGREQKRTIIDYATRADPETDLLSVVGCSHGNTDIANGNGVLAIGRANRIKEALVYAGVPAEMVLDEGCWASTYHTIFPKRGVVLTLKRRRG